MTGWTVLFFIYEEDSQTRKYALTLFQKLREVKNHDALILLAFEAVYSQIGSETIIGKLYNLKHFPSSKSRRKILQKNFGEVNPGNESVLAKVLSYIKTAGLLQEKFLLFTWDHGAGFGIFDGDPRLHSERLSSFMLKDNILAIARRESPQSPGQALPGTPNGKSSNFKVITNSRTSLAKSNSTFKNLDASAGEKMALGVKSKNQPKPGKVRINMLTATEINNALKILNRKTNLLIMMNCWMQMIETGYELTDTVDILVAPETVYFFAGYDYISILNKIAETPNINEVSLATVAINTIEANFEAEAIWRDHLKEIVVSMVDLRKCQKVVDSLTTICKNLIDILPHRLKEIKNIRKKCVDLSKGYFMNQDSEIDNSILNFFIDSLHYLAALSENGYINQGEFQKLKDAVDGFILNQYKGANFREFNNETKTFLGNGISIFHPSKYTDFTQFVYYDYFYKNKKIKFASTGWGDFLSAYKEKENQK